MKCKNCKQPVERLMILALLEDAGAKCYPNALYCSEGNEHDFSEPLPAIEVENERTAKTL